MEKIGRHSIHEVFCLLEETESTGVVVFDLDYTLRQPLSHGLHGRFGEIPQSSIDSLSMLKQLGWTICVVTNQPKKGHQIARLIGNLRNYHFFPDSLEDLLGEESVFGGSMTFLWPTDHYKKGEKSVRDVLGFIAEKVSNGSQIIVVGDKTTDEIFARKLNADLFIKLPDPPYLDTLEFLPEPLREFILKLIP